MKEVLAQPRQHRLRGNMKRKDCAKNCVIESDCEGCRNFVTLPSDAILGEVPSELKCNICGEDINNMSGNMV